MRGNRICGGSSYTTVIAGAPPLPPSPNILEKIAVISESGPGPVTVNGGEGDISHGHGRGVTGP